MKEFLEAFLNDLKKLEKECENLQKQSKLKKLVTQRD
jgi:hypothetical protein